MTAAAAILEPEPAPAPARKCRTPHCKDGVQLCADGQLDQCMNTYLPALVWTCNHCARQDFEPVPGARWRPLP